MLPDLFLRPSRRRELFPFERENPSLRMLQFGVRWTPSLVAAATVFRSILLGSTHGLAFSSERDIQSMREQFNASSTDTKEKQP
jgi:hypothetical protein